ncbi:MULTISPECIES: hypothetical protein [Marinobacter]|uniref:hypothetical protein n=1 Tax=Marinobacter TaxID=2742 RepID=UPI001B1EDA4A|nr:hypothetical protein [Marinobacter sp.]MBO6811713.1 hypothetical protein [Marinobacter sp.]MBO6875058.1 hypothetical protein [Marinobacter sp.]
MKFTERYQPGWFFKGTKPFLAVSHIAQTAQMTNVEVEAAIVNGHFETERIAGCRVVPLCDVFRYVELRATGWGENAK